MSAVKGMQSRIEWDRTWIDTNFNGYPTLQEMLVGYNKAHDTEYRYTTFKAYCQRNGYKKANLTKEQDNFIRDNYKCMGVQKLTDEYNSRFGTNKTYKQMRGLVMNRKLTCDYDVKRYLGKNSILSDGEISRGWKEPHVKVSNGKFINASRYFYEKEHGKLKPNEIVIRLDGDCNNYDMDNLMAISRAENALMAKNGLYSTNGTLTKAGIMLCRLKRKIKDAEKEEGIWK